MTQQQWEDAAKELISVAHWIKTNGGNARAAYAAAEDALWRALKISLTSDTSEKERERLNKLHDAAYQAMKVEAKK